MFFQDRGGEYRSLLGVPGGLSGPMADPIKEEAAKRGLTLREGSGGDPDTLMRNTVSAGRERCWDEGYRFLSVLCFQGR